MKSLSQAFKDHLAGELTTLATCWRVTRTDGVVMGFTDHDADLVVNGVTYKASSGYSAASLASQSDLSVDNTEVDAILNEIDEADLAAGLYDDAEVHLLLVNWQDPSQGTLALRRGWLGQVTLKAGMFTAELRGLTQALQQTIGENYSATCRADLGDARCKVDLSQYTVTGAVTGVAGDQRTFTDSSRAEANGYFHYGLLTWTGGANNGYAMEVKSFSAGQFQLSQAMPYPIQVGDTYTVYAGCDKRIGTCISKFSNVINFRGEPYVPGVDSVTKFGNPFG